MKKSSIFQRGCVALFLVAWLSLLAVPASAQEGTYPIDTSPSELTWSPSGEYLMTGYTGGFILWDGDTGDLVRRYPFLRDERERYIPFITAAVWSPDSTRLAMRIYSELRGPLLRVVAIPSGDTVWEISDAGYFTRRAWSPDGTRIATVYEPTVRADLSVRILDASNGQVLLDIPVTERGYGGPAKWSPSGTIVAVAAGDDEWGSALIFYDGVTGAELRRIPHESPIMDFDWSPDGMRVVTLISRMNIDPSADQRNARVWDVTTGAMLHQYISPADIIEWSPTEDLLAGRIDSSIGIIDVNTGTILHQVPGRGEFLQWKPDGTVIATIRRNTPLFITREGVELPRVPTIIDFGIVDLGTDQVIANLSEGMRVDPVALNALGELEVDAYVNVDNVGSVVFNLNGEFIVDNDLFYGIPLPPPGSYTLTATPYQEPDGQGTPGTPLTVNFTVVGD